MTALFVGGKYNGMRFNADSLELLPEWTGKYSEDNSKFRNMGACVPRAELDNRPLMKGYLGPMWDGGELRYETQEVYNMLSC